MLAGLGLASAQNVDIDGLEEQTIDKSFEANGVNFQTGYLNKTVSYKNLFIPEKYQEHLNGFSANYTESDSNGASSLSIDFSFNQLQDSSELPRVLDGYSYQADYTTSNTTGETVWTVQSSMDIADDGTGTSIEEDADYDMTIKNVNNTVGRTGFLSPDISADGSLNRKINGSQQLNNANLGYNASPETFSLDMGLIKPNVSSYYEHLIVEHDVRSSVSPDYGETKASTKKVYSGKDTEKLITGAEFTRNGDLATKTINYPNLYENKTSKLLYSLVPKSGEQVDITAELGVGISETTEPYSTAADNLESAGIPDDSIIQDTGDFNIKVYNVTFPAESNKTVSIDYNYSGDPRVEDTADGVKASRLEKYILTS